MAQWDKLLARVLRGQSDANIAFDDLCGLLERLGFDEAIIGDHHIFRKTGLAEIEWEGADLRDAAPGR